MAKQSVDVMLSCGHTVIVDIDAEIFAPQFGEEMTCPRCGEKAAVQNVGVPWLIADEQGEGEEGSRQEQPGQLHIPE